MIRSGAYPLGANPQLFKNKTIFLRAGQISMLVPAFLEPFSACNQATSKEDAPVERLQADAELTFDIVSN